MKVTGIDDAALQELSVHISTLQQEKSEQESVFQQEKSRLGAELSRKGVELKEMKRASEHDRQKIQALEEEVRSLKAQSENDAHSRKVIEQRNSELLTDLQSLRRGQADALSSATDKAKDIETLRLELNQARKDFKEAKDLEESSTHRIASLLEEQTVTLRNLEEARRRGENLESQIKAATDENSTMSVALRDAEEQKEKLLRAQAQEHDRIMRDHIAEADGDRAILEQQFFEVKAAYDNAERQLKESKSQIDVLHADAAGLREELQRTEHELREAKHVERVLRNDLSEGRASQSDYEQRISERDRLVAQLLNVAIALHQSNSKASQVLQPLSVHPATTGKAGAGNGVDSLILPPRIPLGDDPLPIDPSDPAAALELLRSYDFDGFAEIVSKVASVVRKWQKQCKEYRERSKGKISFRNFAKGDLALFLPTRNSVSKPWAAFNGRILARTPNNDGANFSPTY